MRSVVVVALLTVACSQGAPRHRTVMETHGSSHTVPWGSGATSGAGGGGSGSIGADAGASWCDTLATCCATLDPMDPARSWCYDAIGRGSEDDCAWRLDDLAASGWCE